MRYVTDHNNTIRLTELQQKELKSIIEQVTKALRSDMNEQRNMLTIRAAAEYAQVSRELIDQAIMAGELSFERLGKVRRRIRLDDLDRWIDSKTVKEIRR